MRRIAFVFGLLTLPTAALADRVFLDNGKVFDDVVVVARTDDEISFRLASGIMHLPASWVVRVDRQPGALQGYLESKARLEAETASAEDWVELALWARSHGVRHGFREALVRAAELDPLAGSLPPLMASIGFYLYPDRNAWAPGAPPARPSSGAETTPASAPRADLAPERPGRSGEVAAELARAIGVLAEAELERTRARTEPEPATVRTVVQVPTYSVGFVPFGYPASGWVFRGEPLKSPNADPRNPVVRRPLNRNARALLARPPGSLLPVSAYRD